MRTQTQRTHVLAMIVGDEAFRRGPLPVALGRAGFQPRETFTTDEADGNVIRRGADDCVLIVDAALLGSRAGSATWTAFLGSHRGVGAVLVAQGPAAPEARALADGAHRVLLEDPVEPAAVVEAARRASSNGTSNVSP